MFPELMVVYLVHGIFPSMSSEEMFCRVASIFAWGIWSSSHVFPSLMSHVFPSLMVV